MEVKVGTRISLNLAKRSYYFQGSGGINLRKGIEETTVIPEEISDDKLDMIKRSLSSGQIRIGWPEEQKPDVKYEQDDDLILAKGVRKITPALEEIAKTPGKGDKSPVARLEKILDLEKGDKNRKTVVSKVEELLDLMSGISSVVEEEKEEIKINLA